MPLAEKLRKLEKGVKVRPPREWWNKTRKSVKRQYPKYLERRIDKITAGIWHNYPKNRKVSIIKTTMKQRAKLKQLG